MNNVTTKVSKDGKKLTIEIDLTQDFGLSKSGKSVSIASTLGNKQVVNGVYLGLNLYKYANVKAGV